MKNEANINLITAYVFLIQLLYFLKMFALVFFHFFLPNSITISWLSGSQKKEKINDNDELFALVFFKDKKKLIFCRILRLQCPSRPQMGEKEVELAEVWTASSSL